MRDEYECGYDLGYEDGKEVGAETERDKIIEWLRSLEDAEFVFAADAIEREDHLK